MHVNWDSGGGGGGLSGLFCGEIGVASKLLRTSQLLAIFGHQEGNSDLQRLPSIPAPEKD